MRYSNTDVYLLLTACALAYCVIVLGAYVRLSDAGLGCPDWPGCYGKLLVPGDEEAVARANQAYPERPLQHAEAWKEMVHRYAAASLGLIILFLAARSWFARTEEGRRLVPVRSMLLLLVIFQGALGMWTVTLLLKPLVVTAHLLGGMAILALLFWALLESMCHGAARAQSTRPLSWVLLALVTVLLQISLGGWTSANYAALVCTDFPMCQGSWWPPMDFREGFVLWRGLGIDYEGGVLDGPARTAIHVSHRIGAMLTLLIVGGVALRSALAGDDRQKKSAAAVLVILLLQLSLGIANVLFLLPLPVAVAHNGVAALLLLSVVSLLYFSVYSDK